MPDPPDLGLRDSKPSGRDWVMRSIGPVQAEHTVLFLPGGLCTAAFFDDLLAEPALTDAALRLVAVTPPGFGGVPLPERFDPTTEGFADLIGELVAELRCHVLVGHSAGANIALELAARRGFAGSLVLLSPTFSAEDEVKELRTLSQLGSIPVVGWLAWKILFATLSSAFRGSFLTARHDALIAEMRTTDPRVARRMLPRSFAYLARHGSLVDRLCQAGVRTWVVRGDHDEVGLTEDEQRGLEACPIVTMVEVPDAGHMVMIEQPSRVARLIVDVVGATSKAP
jgi:pimeloyl-ACP methyl ester carboxylesterase